MHNPLRNPNRQDIFWILDSACAGKSTLAHALAAETGADVVDMDGRLYGSYFPLYHPDTTPALHQQFHHPHPLAWALSLSWTAYHAHTRLADAELLELLLDEINQMPKTPLIIDGGFSHPAVLTARIPAETMICLTLPDDLRGQIWQNAPDRQEMRDWISALPDPGEKWRTFLHFDKQIDRQMRREAEAAHILLLHRTHETPLTTLVAQARRRFLR